MEIESKYTLFHSWKCAWNCHLEWQPFCPGGDELIHLVIICYAQMSPIRHWADPFTIVGVVNWNPTNRCQENFSRPFSLETIHHGVPLLVHELFWNIFYTIFSICYALPWLCPCIGPEYAKSHCLTESLTHTCVTKFPWVNAKRKHLHCSVYYVFAVSYSDTWIISIYGTSLEKYMYAMMHDQNFVNRKQEALNFEFQNVRKTAAI